MRENPATLSRTKAGLPSPFGRETVSESSLRGHGLGVWPEGGGRF